MVDLEQATTSVEWSYVAAVDSVRRSEGKSYGAPGREVGEAKGDQSWVFFGGNDVKAATPVLWPPHAKS